MNVPENIPPIELLDPSLFVAAANATSNGIVITVICNPMNQLFIAIILLKNLQVIAKPISLVKTAVFCKITTGTRRLLRS